MSGVVDLGPSGHHCPKWSLLSPKGSCGNVSRSIGRVTYFGTNVEFNPNCILNSRLGPVQIVTFPVTIINETL